MSNKCITQEYYGIDLFKFICAALVMAIHVPPLISFSKVGNFYLVDVLARIAVPFFYASSGFFLFRNMTFCNGKVDFSKKNRDKIKSFVGRIIKLYLIWSAIYLLWQIPYWQSINWTGLAAIKDYVLSLYISGSVYHFWYFVCLIYAVPILFLLLHVCGIRLTAVFAVVVYVFKCLIYSYNWLNIPKLGIVVGYYEKISGIADAICLSIPFLMVGVLCSRNLDENFRISKKREMKLTISFMLLTIEASLLYFLKTETKQYSYIIFTLPTCFLLFSVVRHLSHKVPGDVGKFRKIRKYSTVMYCVHPFLLYLLGLSKIFNGWNSLMRYIIVLIGSILVSKLMVWCSEKKIKVMAYLY